MSKHAIFGYGSLILPPSIVSRFADLPPIDSVYEANLTCGDAGLVREEALAEWNARQDEFEVIPVRVQGFRREYTHESRRGGTMLTTTYTGNDSDVMNGLLVSGYSESEYDAISDTEEGYDIIKLSEEDFKSYGAAEVSLQHPIRMYVSGECSQVVMKRRNQTYHSRILAGIDMLEDIVDNSIVARFHTDFLQTTYERPISGGCPDTSTLRSEERQAVIENWMNSVAENNRAESNFVRLFC